MTRIIIFSGAGLSQESGIATFRDKDGLWENHKVSEVCTYLTWERHYDLVHDFYDARRSQLTTVQPNPAHHFLAALERDHEVLHYTQNIDDLMERAGSTKTVHLHGFLTEMRCCACDHVWDIGYSPHGGAGCPNCGATKIKPNVVFFGETAPRYPEFHKTIKNLQHDDIVVVVGTSGVVIDVSKLLRFRKGRKILCNMEPTRTIRHSLFDRTIWGPVGENVDRIREEIAALMR